MAWFKRKPPAPTPVVPDDVGEARELQQQSARDHADAVRSGFVVDRVTSYLNERRALNHFGESIEITFTRRGHA